MRKFLSLAFCFFFLQIFSCSIGEVEPQPESTKFIMQNNSTVFLKDVWWNGTPFGELDLGWISEQLVRDGYSYVFFKTDNGEYRTRDLVIGEKYRSNKFVFIDGTVVININNTTNICSLATILKCDNPSSSEED